MKKIDLALLIGLIATVIISNYTSFLDTYDSIQKDVLRLHILANSDSVEDQSLKLDVRDKILECSDELFQNCDGIDDMEECVSQNLDKIKDIAEGVIADEGYDYSVNCELVNMEFDERVYEDITMPAGTYDALRITIGKAEGHNWWCVMYPPLCIPAAEDKSTVDVDEDEAENAFDDDEYDLITNPQKYEVKFKTVEIFKALKAKFF